jgi:hypothetical protein
MWTINGQRLLSQLPFRRSFMSTQAVLYIIAIILLVIAALPIPARGFNVALLGAAFALLAFSWPVLSA